MVGVRRRARRRVDLAHRGDRAAVIDFRNPPAPDAASSLLTNGGMEQWSRGPGGFSANGAYGPDRWQISLGPASTMTVARDTANVDVGSLYCAAVTYTHAALSQLAQNIEFYPQLLGRMVTLAVRVKTATAGAVRVAVYDTVNATRYGAYHGGGGVYQTL